MFNICISWQSQSTSWKSWAAEQTELQSSKYLGHEPLFPNRKQKLQKSPPPPPHITMLLCQLNGEGADMSRNTGNEMHDDFDIKGNEVSSCSSPQLQHHSHLGIQYFLFRDIIWRVFMVCYQVFSRCSNSPQGYSRWVITLFKQIARFGCSLTLAIQHWHSQLVDHSSWLYVWR